MKLLVATSNGDKLREIRQILMFPWLEIVGLDEFPSPQRVGEDGETFEANAIKKARTFALATGNWTMADDSGLEVHALKGAPGVRSARYAGELGDYEANNRKLLGELKGRENRRATFRCVLALSDPQGRVWTVEGVCHGVITEEPRGSGGFGYDPIFVPDGLTMTFAEMPPELKNALSHRGRALQKAQKEWFEPGGIIHIAGRRSSG